MLCTRNYFCAKNRLLFAQSLFKQNLYKQAPNPQKSNAKTKQKIKDTQKGQSKDSGKQDSTAVQKAKAFQSSLRIIQKTTRRRPNRKTLQDGPHAQDRKKTRKA